MLRSDRDFSITINTRISIWSRDKVLLYLINIKTYLLLKKLNIRYLGPFKLRNELVS